MWEWELVNESKPIWLRTPSEVEEEEYTKFYQSLTSVRSSVHEINPMAGSKEVLQVASKAQMQSEL